MMEEYLYQHDVNRGVARLNEIKPGWYREIDLETLLLSSCSNCVLGQLYGAKFTASAPLLHITGHTHLVAEAFMGNNQWLQDHGFWHNDTGRSYSELTKTWKETILNLRAQDTAGS